MAEKQKAPATDAPTNRYANPHGRTAWSRAGATTAFKAINPELFVKPNKFTTVVGLIALTGCVTFVAYMHAQDENRQIMKEQDTYKAVDEDGKFTKVEKRRSRWD